jgi:hypothetical protein
LLQALRYGLSREDAAAVATTSALLGSLWVGEANFTRLETLIADTAWVLSHARPEPALVEVTRTAAVLGALIAFLMPDLSPLRTLVTLHRLPPATPDSTTRALHGVLCAPDVPALQELSAGDEPLLAGFADLALSHIWENVNEYDRSLVAARRMLAGLTDDSPLLMRGLAHSRAGELCLQLEPGDAAYHHFVAALSIATELGWSSGSRGQWALIQANVQRGAYDEAERGLEETAAHGGDDSFDTVMFEVCVRAEILLGRGDVDGGLRLWRQAADRARSGADLGGLWPFETESVAVVRHALHGRLDQVREIVDSLPGALATMIPDSSAPMFRVCGSLLLALGLADLDRGDTASAVRLLALAGRFGLLRGFHPAMSPEQFEVVADRPAYAEAVSSYAGLELDELRAAALAALHSREPA